MGKTITFVGLDVHEKSISVAVAEEGVRGAVRFVGTIPNTPGALTKLAGQIEELLPRWSMAPAVEATTRENGCLRLIPGSHRARELLAHEIDPSPEVTLNQELPAAAFDQSRAVDLVLEAGQVSLRDGFPVHGSEANASAQPRRGMTLRFMPTTSVFDRELADDLYRRIGSAPGATDPWYDGCGPDSRKAHKGPLTFYGV